MAFIIHTTSWPTSLSVHFGPIRAFPPIFFALLVDHRTRHSQSDRLRDGCAAINLTCQHSKHSLQFKQQCSLYVRDQTCTQSPHTCTTHTTPSLSHLNFPAYCKLFQNKLHILTLSEKNCKTLFVCIYIVQIPYEINVKMCIIFVHFVYAS